MLSAAPTESLLQAEAVLEPAAVTVPHGTLPSLDVDLNGTADALTDGLLVMRHLFGFTGTALTQGAVDPAGQRTDPTAIADYLESIRPSLDVDLNQQADALTDGIVLMRSLFGFTGTALTSGAVDSNGGRTDPAAIATFLDNLNPQRELIAPLVTAGLQQDTGVSASDNITFNPTITGTIADINQIVSFTAGFDSTPVASFTDFEHTLLPTGIFTLSANTLAQIAGGTLTDGTHTLHLRVTDANGNLTTLDRTFTLDTVAPVSPTFDLAVTSDTGTVGDHETTAAVVTLRGQTDPTTAIQWLGPGTSTLSNGTGSFQLLDLALAMGASTVTLRATDLAGNQSEFTRVLTRLAATQQADVVLTWNQTMLEAIRLDATAPPIASRGLAMVSLAMFDAINAIDGTPGYYVSLPAVQGTDPNAAAAAAAHRMLSYLYPGQQVLFDAQLANSLSSIPDGPGKTNGLALGRSVADAIIAIRSTDGWNDFVDDVPGTQPGDWQPTAPMCDLALLPQWADLTPFALTSPDQFRPAGPPALDSAAYAAALNEVQSLGAATGSTRMADQTEIARFWADGAGTYTPPGHWNVIAQEIALEQGHSLSANARLFAQLNVALADAGITAWNTKYEQEFWRPITAIQEADRDGNAATTADPHWTPLLLTPPFPEYVSGHSTYSGAAAGILTAIFGPTVGFTTESLGLPGVQRSFTSFEQAAQEAGRSRIYGGIHFEFSNQDGLTAGHQVADAVLSRFTVTTDTQGPTILVTQPNNRVTNTNLTLTGQVLDNLSGVATFQAQVDNGPVALVTIDATGHFTFSTNLALDGTADGSHTITFDATDLQNNLSTLAFTFTLDTIAPTITLTSPADNATLAVGTRLTGTANATGSRLVELCYQFDNGTLVPLSFDPTTGSFDQALDLSRLAVGAHTLNLRAQDQAGNVSTVTRTVTLDAAIPLTITDMTPAAGASDVGSTFRPQVFFSRPINPATLNSNNFYATDTTGTRLAATIVPSQDGTFAWLFFTNPLPGASTITLHVDGTTILAAGDGQALDADGDGTPGGTFTSTFSTVSLVPLQGTTLSGRVLDPGPDLRMGTYDDLRAGADGILHTEDDVFLNPIAGATVYILGLESQAVVTDAQGYFSFTAVPSGTIKLAIDGRTATNAPTGFYFPEMVMDLEIDVGQANTVMGTMGTREERAANLTRPEVYLPRLQTSILQTVSDTENTTIGVDAEAAPNLTEQQRQYLTLEIQPGSLVDANGNPIANGQVGISTVPPELVRDMLPPGVLQHTFDITIQAPDAAAFTTPLQMTFPNVFNVAPGTTLNFLSFDHTTGRLVIEGTATVSADGLSVVTDPGQGITKPGWHGLTPLGFEFTLEYGRPCVDASLRLKNLLHAFPLAVGHVFNAASDGLAILSGQVTSRALSIASAIASWATTLGTHGFGVNWATTGAMSGTAAAASPNGSPFQALMNNIGTVSGVMDYSSQISGVRQLIHEARSLPPCENYIDEDPAQIADRASQAADQLLASAATQAPLFAQLAIEAQTINQIAGQANPNLPNFGLSPVAQSQLLSAMNTYVSVANQILQQGPFYVHLVDFMTSVSSFIARFAECSSSLLSAGAGGGGSGAGQGAGALGTQTYYWAAEYSGVVLRGSVSSGRPIQFFAPPDTLLRVTLVDPIGERVGSLVLLTDNSGQRLRICGIPMSEYAGLPDEDSDGLPDLAEVALGTNSRSTDTDMDNLGDLIEIAQGLDPLGGRAFPTGIVASLPLQGQAKAVTLEGSATNAETQTAYVATGSYGLAIIDASQFQRPIVLGQIDLPGDAVDVSVDARLGIAAVAGTTGLYFVNVSDPTRPTLTSTVNIPAVQVEVADGVAYVAAGAGLESYSIATGELLQVLPLGGTTITALAREGTLLYARDASGTLRAVDINGLDMTLRGSLGGLPTGGKVFVGNGVAYIGAGDGNAGGFATVNVTNPAAMVLLSGVDANNVQGQAIAVNGSGLAVSVGTFRGPVGQPIRQVNVLDVRDPANTAGFITSFDLADNPYDVAIGAGIAFVADGTGGLKVVNYQSFDNRGQAPTITVNAPNADLDLATPGIQVLEGSLLNLRLTVNDDVQVRNVELLVNGQVVTNDVSFPWTASVPMPTITPESSTATIQARATDTGGNRTLSDPLTIELVPDTFAPTLISSNVADGSRHAQSFRTVRMTFDEPLDPASITAEHFRVLDAGDQFIVPTDVALSTNGRTVLLTLPTLEQGTYRLVTDGDQITDRAGNAFGTAGLVLSSFSIVEATIEWSAVGGGDWNNPANWDLGRVPTATDVVLLNAISSGTINISGTPVRVQGIESFSPVTLSTRLQVDGFFTAHESVTLSGGILAGTTLNLDPGEALVVTANSSNRVEGVTIHGDLDLNSGNARMQVRDLVLNGTARLWNGSTLGFDGTQTLGGQATIVMEGTSVSSRLVMVSAGTLTLGPEVLVRGGYGMIGDSYFWNAPMTLINQGTIRADVSGRYVQLGANATLLPSVTNQGVLEAANGGTLYLRGGSFANAGVLRVRDTGSVLDVEYATGWTSSGSLVVEGGTLLPGEGIFTNAGSMSIRAGALVPITGGYTQTASGSLSIDVGGLLTSQFGRMTVTGAATLDGTLNVSLVNGFTPALNDRFRFMTFGSCTDFFATQNGLDLGGGLAFQVDQTDPLDLELVTVAAAPASTSQDLLAGMAVLDAAGLSTTDSDQPSTDLSLASVQQSWLQEFVAGDARVDEEDEEELLITLPG